jgi:hypothetical protein
MPAKEARRKAPFKLTPRQKRASSNVAVARKHGATVAQLFEKAPQVFIKAVPARITSKVKRDADHLFDGLIMKTGLLGRYKVHEKKLLFQSVCKAFKEAIRVRGVVPYSKRGKDRDSLYRVIATTIKAGLADELTGHRGNNKMSILIPTNKAKKLMGVITWKDHEDGEPRQLVFLHKRKAKDDESKVELPFDPKHPTAVMYQSKLEKVNALVREHEIDYRPKSRWNGEYTKHVPLFPILVARFTESFDLHGRLYTDGPAGHQGLTKDERRTIRFDGHPSVELDYGSFHCRMLYHLKGIDHPRDPYALWEETTEPMRLLAKVAINTLINADSPASAVSSCNNAMNHHTEPKDKEGPRKRKTGKKLDDARHLYDAYKATGLKFDDVIDLAMRRHPRIADQFGKDMGIRLMRIDSEIALNVAFRLSRRCIPCLPVHDSFIVPKAHTTLLKRLMISEYRKQVGEHTPVVK